MKKFITILLITMSVSLFTGCFTTSEQRENAFNKTFTFLLEKGPHIAETYLDIQYENGDISEEKYNKYKKYIELAKKTKE